MDTILRNLNTSITMKKMLHTEDENPPQKLELHRIVRNHVNMDKSDPYIGKLEDYDASTTPVLSNFP